MGLGKAFTQSVGNTRCKHFVAPVGRNVWIPVTRNLDDRVTYATMLICILGRCFVGN